jgi:hypothetical protein
MTMMRGVSVCWVAGVVGLVLLGSATARADDCDRALAAAIAQAKVPHAVTHVMTMEGKPPSTMEMIFTDDKAYTQIDGAWRAMPFSAQRQIDMLNAAKARDAQAKRTCHTLGDESVNGEAATVLVMHSEANDRVTDGRIWLSDRTGLALKSEVHLSNGSVINDAFRYGNIQAPPGVN